MHNRHDFPLTAWPAGPVPGSPKLRRNEGGSTPLLVKGKALDESGAGPVGRRSGAITPRPRNALFLHPRRLHMHH